MNPIINGEKKVAFCGCYVTYTQTRREGEREMDRKLATDRTVWGNQKLEIM